MHKSTIIFSVIAALLATVTSVVIWRLIDNSHRDLPQVEGTAIGLGLPEREPGNAHRHYTARSVVVWDTATQRINFEQNAFERLPVASLTKLMTAMVASDYGIAWQAPATIELHEYGIGGQLLLHPGEEATMRDLFNASLLGSANNATLAYVRQLGVDQKEFIRAMNRKAIAIGLEQTYFVDVTGLSKGNISTAYEVARLAEHAFAHYPEIATATQQASYTFTLQGSGRSHTIKNTNKLIAERGEVYSGSKTGYLDEARYCLVVRGAGDTKNRIAVILGSPGEQEHLLDMQQLMRMRVW
ncbi:MAG: serine hydrolase [Candidatus Andersenbacteria bacterium]